MSAQSSTSSETMTVLSNLPDTLVNYNYPTYSRIILFDWDDTLFCTKYWELHSVNFFEIFSFRQNFEDSFPYIVKELKLLENAILELFEDLLEKELEWYIVSNADLKWINNCLIHFLPEWKAFIEENKIQIYSAKNKYSKNYSVKEWKNKCFKQLLWDNYKERNSSLEVIAVGDSVEEKWAAIELNGFKRYDYLNVKFIETIKFPSCTTIINQLNYLRDRFDTINQSTSFLYQLNILSVGITNTNTKIDCNQSGFDNKYRIYLNKKRKLKRELKEEEDEDEKTNSSDDEEEAEEEEEEEEEEDEEDNIDNEDLDVKEDI